MNDEGVRMRRTTKDAQLCRGFLRTGSSMLAFGSSACAAGPSIPSCPSRRRAVTLALVAIAAAGALWILLAPAQLGRGGVIHSVSRLQPAHRVGQVVAYGSELLHGAVRHRIPFRGVDNSSDSSFPLGTVPVGRLTLRVPRIGSVLPRLTQPRQGAALVALVSLLVAASVVAPRVGRRTPRSAEPEPRPAGTRLVREGPA